MSFGGPCLVASVDGWSQVRSAATGTAVSGRGFAFEEAAVVLERGAGHFVGFTVGADLYCFDEIFSAVARVQRSTVACSFCSLRWNRDCFSWKLL